MKRNMTGFYVRIERGDKWQAVEIDQMTDLELEIFFKDNPASAKWAIGLAKWIRDSLTSSEL